MAIKNEVKNEYSLGSLLSRFLFLTPARRETTFWREREGAAGGGSWGKEKKKKNRNASSNTRAQLVSVVSVF